MSKQLLIEHSPWGISFDKKDLSESIEIKEQGNIIMLKGVPCTILNKKNQNGRNYSTQMMEQSLKEAQEFIASRSALCQAHDHPDGSFVRPIDASHIVTRAYIETIPNVGDVLFNDWEILPTSKGKDLAALINSNVSVGTSIRGLGNMNGCMVEDYEYLGTDVVGNPSSGTFTKMFDKPVKVESVESVAKTEDTQSENLIVEQTNVNEQVLGEKDMSEHLPELNKAGIEIAVTNKAEPIEAWAPYSVENEKEPKPVAELEPARGKEIGAAPSVDDGKDPKKVGDQSYMDRANVLAREQNKMGDRCLELSKLLEESRNNLASTAEKYNQSQKLTNDLMIQLKTIHEALGGKDPNEFRDEYEHKLQEMKESADKRMADYISEKKEKTIAMAQELVEEAARKHKELSESYEAKLSEKESKIESLTNVLKESSEQLRMKKVENVKNKLQWRRESGIKLHETVENIANTAADVNEKLIKESVNLVEMALQEGKKIREELTSEIEKQKVIFEEVSKFFDIACVINEELSTALNETCSMTCKKHRKESARRIMRGHR